MVVRLFIRMDEPYHTFPLSLPDTCTCHDLLERITSITSTDTETLTRYGWYLVPFGRDVIQLPSMNSANPIAGDTSTPVSTPSSVLSHSLISLGICDRVTLCFRAPNDLKKASLIRETGADLEPATVLTEYVQLLEKNATPQQLSPVLRFIDRHIHTIIDEFSKQFHALKQDYLLTLLRRHTLNIPELQLFQAVIDWGKSKQTKPEPHPLARPSFADDTKTQPVNDTPTIIGTNTDPDTTNTATISSCTTDTTTASTSESAAPSASTSSSAETSSSSTGASTATSPETSPATSSSSASTSKSEPTSSASTSSATTELSTILADIIHEIRFPIMSSYDIKHYVAPTNVLSFDLCTKLISYVDTPDHESQYSRHHRVHGFLHYPRTITPSLFKWSTIHGSLLHACSLHTRLSIRRTEGDGLIGSAWADLPFIKPTKTTTTESLSSSTKGVYIWRLKFHQLFLPNPSRMYVGIMEAAAHQWPASLQISKKNNLQGNYLGWLWQLSNRMLISNSTKQHSREPYGVRVKSGDTITIKLDMETGTMEYAVNGRALGVAFRGIGSNSVRALLYVEASSPEDQVDVSLSFPEKFCWPISSINSNTTTITTTSSTTKQDCDIDIQHEPHFILDDDE